MRKALIWVAVVVAALYVTGCGTSGGGASSDADASEGKVRVTASISVLQDFVERVGGDRVEVSTLVPVGGSPHTFQPSPSDAQRISESRVVFQNGLGLDDWTGDLLESAGSEDVKVVKLAEGLKTIEGGEHEHGGEAEHAGEEHADEGHAGEHEHSQGNPHLWLDVSNAQVYVGKIKDALIEADPEGAEVYRANAKEYLAELEDLDRYIRKQADEIPEENRKFVTFHDAFPYFARAYGFDLVGVVLQNPGAEPSSSEVADQVRKIESEEVPAVFTETQFNPKLADTIGDEANVEVYELYALPLGKKPAGSYESMMRTDIDRIKEGLDGR